MMNGFNLYATRVWMHWNEFESKHHEVCLIVVESFQVLAAYLSKWTEGMLLDEIKPTKRIDIVHP